MRDYLRKHVGETLHVAKLDGGGVAVARFDKREPPEEANDNSSGLGARGGADAKPTVGVWLRGALADPEQQVTWKMPDDALIPDLMLQASDVAGVLRGPVTGGAQPPEWSSSRLVEELAPIFQGSRIERDELGIVL